MPKLARLLFLVLAIAGLIALSGCGDDESTTTAADTSSESTEATEPSDEEVSSTIDEALEDPDAEASSEYGEELTTILGDFAQSFQDQGAVLQGTTDPAQLADGIDQLEETLDTTIDDLSALDVPEEAQEGHDEIVASFENLSSKLADVSDAVDSDDAAAATKAASALQASVADFTEQFTAGLTKVAGAGIEIDSSSLQTSP